MYELLETYAGIFIIGFIIFSIIWNMILEWRDKKIKNS